MISPWLLIIVIFLVVAVPTIKAAVTGAPWVPSRAAVVQQLADDLSIGPKDTVVDLGAGTGSVLQAAARRGAKAIGFELSPPIWLIAKLKLLGNPLATVRLANFYRAVLPKETTVVFFFLVPKTINQAQKYLQSQELPQLRAVVSYAFRFPGVPPQRIVQVPKIGTAYVYRPADLLTASPPHSPASVSGEAGNSAGSTSFANFFVATSVDSLTVLPIRFRSSTRRRRELGGMWKSCKKLTNLSDNPYLVYG